MVKTLTLNAAFVGLKMAHMTNPNIARKCKIRVSKWKEALANSEAQRRNLEPTVCVGTMGPTQTVGDVERGYGWLLSDHFHGKRSELREKYGLRSLCLLNFRCSP